ncbi:TetR/AcrR family transcriptional regulator [Maribacter polysaccharolyticus]|uniref:TetR/AcrR family transcriptional regulator n=1 Tax=Maribacter polysaccharolyticus TaxID=3020831 RepID=UPI00237FA0B4|nr:TetR/AcrR family transcriptional regulator [Maribacter polysaccharolyticus]MDE3740932.1 TetR/AcrR family transcriptional regulator [Maribacter polysaccharolyticus]
METASYNKKDLILEKATTMFTKYGIHSLSMDDIANECGVSKRTIYKFYQNKADLIDKIIGVKIANFKREITAITAASENAVVELPHFFEYYKLAISSYSPTLIREIKRYNLKISLGFSRIDSEVILPFVFKNIERGQHEGLYKETLDREELSESILNMLNYIFTDDSVTDIENVHRTLDFFGKLLMHRLVTVKGLDLLNAQNL